MMRVRRTERRDDLRLYIVLAGMVLAFLVLAGSLWRLQVANVSRFEDRQKIQSLRRVRLPGIRGKVYDRNDLCLADNRPAYAIALFLEDVRKAGRWSRTIDHAMEVMQQVADVTGLEPRLDRDDIWNHIRRRLPLPLILWQDVGPSAMARLAEQGGKIPGVDIYTQATRHYPYSPYTSHLIGYVGRADLTKLENAKDYSYYIPEMSGRAGLEKLFDESLRGEAGWTLVQIDVSGYRHGELAHRAPSPGTDLRLTVDMEVQLLAHQALGETRGAVVVLDPNNGDVLAMLSAPGFDANRFVPYITSRDWKALSENPEKPLLNRAVAGVYPPASTFKPLVGLAASTVEPDTVYQVYDSPGAFRLGRRTFRDWNWNGHGEVNLQQALMRSANAYFFKTALHIGWQPIVEQARAVGLGQKTGVEVDFEQPGLVPDDAWKRRRGLGGWADGDTCNLSIGQGFLGATPVQMAMVVATIANGGYLYKPRLVKAYRAPGTDKFVETPVRRVGKMVWTEEALTVVRSGMHDVVMAERGTAKQARVPGLDFAAKTGTAEYGKKSEGKKHTWMIAFAPYENPQYAVAFLIEDGRSGGSTVGPRLKILLEGLYKKMVREGTLQAPQVGLRVSVPAAEGGVA